MARELELVPADRIVFLANGAGKPFTPEYFGNWFRDRAGEAKVPGSIHGVRTAKLTAIANAGAPPDEICTFLGHKINAEGSTKTDKADREKLAERTFDKMSVSQSVPNFSAGLDKKVPKSD